MLHELFLVSLLGLSPSTMTSAAADREVDPQWWEATSQRLTDTEYEATWQSAVDLEGIDGAWHVVNRAHGFRAYFSENSLQLRSRSAGSPIWSCGFVFSRLQMGGGNFQALRPKIITEGPHLRFMAADLTQSFENSPKGLAHRLVFPSLPSAASSRGSTVVESGRLAVRFELTGDLSALVAVDGRSLALRRVGGGVVLNYRLLTAMDGNGRTLPVRAFGTADDQHRWIDIVVDAGDAIAPITVDAIIAGPVWTVEGDQAGASFGGTVATAGDVNGDGYSDLVVGAAGYDNGQTDEGRVFVYHGSPAGPATLPSWTAEGNQAGGRFGQSVAAAGDVNGDGFSDLIVGAPLYDNGQTDEGRALVYLGSATGLGAASWTAEGQQAFAHFGTAVATAGDSDGDGDSEVVVGADLFDGTFVDEGRAFVYSGSPAGLAPTPSWIANGGQVGARFGVAAMTAGDVDADGYGDLIVSASEYDNGQLNEGQVRLFTGSIAGPSLAPVWSAEGDQVSGRFGQSISTAGDVNADGYSDIVVGAPLQDAAWGRTHVFHGSAEGLSAAPVWSASGSHAGAQFGASVGTAGDLNGDGYADVIVGSPKLDNGHVDEGALHAYRGGPSGLRAVPEWVLEGGATGAELGASVAIAGDVNGDGYSDVVAGAPLISNGQSQEGGAFLFLGGSTVTEQNPSWSTALNVDAINSAGDVNGDGFEDVALGAPLFDNGLTDEGAVFVYHGSALGLSSEPAWVVEGGQASGYFGGDVASAGDINGDGYSDLIVGASSFDDGETNEGKAFVYHGSASGLVVTPSWTAQGNQFGAAFGNDVASAGDVNGDGYGDVIVTARYYSNGETQEGRAFVFHGSPTGLSPIAAWTTESNQANGQLVAAAGAGDVNGDGYSDVVTSAWGADRVSTFHGSSSGLSNVAARILTVFAGSVASAGDVNGDGFADVILGDTDNLGPGGTAGRVLVYHGSPTGIGGTAAWIATGNGFNSHFGATVKGLGDIDGDGYSDVGAASSPAVAYARVYRGSSTGLPPLPDWSGSLFTAIGAADVDGDGFSDVIVGNSAGAAVFPGNGDGLATVRPQQRRADDLVPVDSGGAATGAMRIAALGRSAFGPGRIKLEWELEPLGSPLDGGSLSSADEWTVAGAEGASLSERAGDGTTPGVVHWRARLRHDPASLPFQPHGRWFSPPRNGWQEGDLRIFPAPAAGRVPDNAVLFGTPLLLQKGPAGQLTLFWGSSCAPTDLDYSIYEGTLGQFASALPRACSTSGLTTGTLTAPAGNAFYLVVPHNGVREGSYGQDSTGLPRPPSGTACMGQLVSSCP